MRGLLHIAEGGSEVLNLHILRGVLARGSFAVSLIPTIWKSVPSLNMLINQELKYICLFLYVWIQCVLKRT